MSNPQEIELKLLVPGLTAEAALQMLRRAPSLARRKLRQQQLVNRYFDTPERLLQQQRCALRVRQRRDVHAGAGSEGDTITGASVWVQTLKTAGSSSAGLSQRGEWECLVAADQPERAGLRGTAWDALDPDGALFERLQPCFETRCLRSTWLVARRDGTLLEVSLDAGEVLADGQTQPLLELELELLAGAPTALFELADELARRLPCLPCNLSKAERAGLLANGQLLQPVRARRLERQRGEALPALALRVLGEAQDQFLRNLEGLLHSDAPEWVHQARVGWRRWRSLLRLLRPWVGPGPDFTELRPLLDALGTQRNLDVACSETLPAWSGAWACAQAGAAGGEAALSPPPPDATTNATPNACARALAELQAARHTQRTRLRQTLLEPATGQALLALTRYLWQAGQQPMAIEKRAIGARLARWNRSLHRLLQGEKAQLLDVATLHEARLLAKRLRYGSEAMASTLSAKRLHQSQQWVKDATLWQTRIGQARDAWQLALLLQQHTHAPPALLGFMQGVAAAMERAAQEAASPG